MSHIDNKDYTKESTNIKYSFYVLDIKDLFIVIESLK